MADGRWLIVGLGNPGGDYTQTFHNVGFMAIEYMRQKWGIPLDRHKFTSRYGQGRRHGATLMLMQPETFMNNSGEAVAEAMRWYDIPPERLVVIYDDLDLPMGELRIRKKGSAGTHNGMKSIIRLVGTEDFARIRIGIGPKPKRWDTVRYVLSRIPEDARDAIFDGLVHAAEAVDLTLEYDLDRAMNDIHRKQTMAKRAKEAAKAAEETHAPDKAASEVTPETDGTSRPADEPSN